MNLNFLLHGSDVEQSRTHQSILTKMMVLICLLAISFSNSFAQTNQPPTVVITSPTSGQIFNSLTSVTIIANAVDADGTITKVEFFDLGTKLGEDLTSPFSFTFTPRPGDHKFTARATDNSGATTTTSDGVPITVLNRAPTVAITSPTNSQTFNPLSFVVIVASVSDADGVVTKVEFFDGAVKIGTDVIAPFIFGLTPSPGIHSFTAKAIDNLGATTTSAVVTIKVLNQAPTVAITSPANGQVFNPLSLVTIAANATDADGTIAKVEFFDGAIKVGEDLATPFSFAFTPLAGIHSLTAKATDNFGEITTSAAVSITVLNQAPTVAITFPTNGQVFNSLLPITITANAADADGTIAKVEFFDGTVKLGEDLTAPFSFTFTPSAGNRSLTAKATDNLGATTISAAVSITALNQAPTVTITSPTNGQVFNLFSSVTITADATDVDGTITKVEFFDGAFKVGEDLTAPFSLVFSLGLLNPLLGNHSLTAKATDNLGATTTSAAIIIVANQAPTVAITSPTNGQVFSPLSLVTITANATDADGTIDKVEFFDGATKVGEDLTVPFSFAFTPQAGVHSLTAKATDNLGAATTSAAVSITMSNQVPTVAMTFPTNGQVFNSLSSITITVNATDADGTITKVEFFDGGISPINKIGEDFDTPFTFTFSPQDGVHLLTAIATDNSGAIRACPFVSITVGNQFPTIAITSPTNNQVVNLTPLTIAANATDPDGTIAKVEFFDGAVKLGEDLAVPFTFTSPLAQGNHFLTAKATDNLGASKTSSSVKVIVINQSPDIVITSPTNGQVFSSLSPVTITADATDLDGTITKVEFFEGANSPLSPSPVKLGEDLEAPYSFTFSPADGIHPIFVRAFDNLGSVRTSSVISVTVGNQFPTVSFIYPVNNQVFNFGDPVSVFVDANDPDGTVAKVEFFDRIGFTGSTFKIGESLANPYSLTFTPLVAGDHFLTAVAADNLGATTTSTIVRIVINQAPTVTITSPTNGQFFSSPSAITITANAADVDGTITKVEFFDRTVKLGEDLTTPFTFTFTANSIVPSLTAKATDNLGATTTSAVVEINISFGAQLTVAPHPFTNQTILNNEEGTIRSIKIVDYIGNIRLQSGEVQKGKLVIGETLQPGHYILYVETDKGVSASHLIKSEQ
jgi:hypothetical protein